MQVRWAVALLMAGCAQDQETAGSLGSSSESGWVTPAPTTYTAHSSVAAELEAVFLGQKPSDGFGRALAVFDGHLLVGTRGGAQTTLFGLTLPSLEPVAEVAADGFRGSTLAAGGDWFAVSDVGDLGTSSTHLYSRDLFTGGEGGPREVIRGSLLEHAGTGSAWHPDEPVLALGSPPNASAERPGQGKVRGYSVDTEVSERWVVEAQREDSIDFGAAVAYSGDATLLVGSAYGFDVFEPGAAGPQPVASYWVTRSGERASPTLAPAPDGGAVVGMPTFDEGSGALFLVEDLTVGGDLESSAVASFRGSFEGVSLGTSAIAEDLDGDGVLDLLVGGAGDGQSIRPGFVAFFRGPLEGEYTELDADAVLTGAHPGSGFGRSMVRVDAEGTRYLAVGEDGYEGHGAAMLVGLDWVE